MANSRQEYFILRSDVPIARTNNFFKSWLSSQNADRVLQGELLVREAQPHDGSHAMYSLALDRSKKVSCSISDVIPLSQDDFEWLAAIGKAIDRWKIYIQRDKFEAVKKLQVDERVWVSLLASDEKPSELSGSSCCHATVKYIGPLQGMPGRWAGVETKVKQKVIVAASIEWLHPSHANGGECSSMLIVNGCWFLCHSPKYDIYTAV